MMYFCFLLLKTHYKLQFNQIFGTKGANGHLAVTAGHLSLNSVIAQILDVGPVTVVILLVVKGFIVV